MFVELSGMDSLAGGLVMTIDNAKSISDALLRTKEHREVHRISHDSTKNMGIAVAVVVDAAGVDNNNADTCKGIDMKKHTSGREDTAR